MTKITLELPVEIRPYEKFRPVVGTGFNTPEGVRVNNVHFAGDTVVQMPDGTQYIISMHSIALAAVAHHKTNPTGKE